MDEREATDRSVWAEFTVGMRGRWQQRRAMLRLLPRGGPAVVGTAVALQVVAGLLPIGFVLATAEVIAGVPAAVAGGVDSEAWRELRDHLITAAALFFAIQLLLPVQAFLGELLRRRIDGGIRDRLMADSFRGTGIAVLEDPELLDQAADGLTMLRMGHWSPGAACAGFIALLSRYLQTVAAAAVISFAYAWQAGLAVLVAGLTIRFGYRVGLSVFGRIYRRHQRVRRRRFYFRDLLLTSGPAKEIRIFGLLDWVGSRYAEAFMQGALPVWRQRRRIFYGPYVLYTLTAFVLLSAALAGAARATATGVLTIGAFMIVMQAALTSIRIGAFIAESDVQTEYGMNAETALRRFGELTTAAADGERGGEPVPPDAPVREIRFEQVTFRYTPDSPPVLDGLDLTIPAGASLAIVGLNGAGKTTLVKLLARLYEPESGRITADGVDIRTFDGAAWQRRVAAIFQDFVHFELPVRDNVGFGAAGDHDDAAVEDALRRAGALDFVTALPAGLDTPLSRQYEDGADLSGGQWQRIAIARALMAVHGGARVLVLDEPTAALDARAEVAFFDRFLDLTRGVTSLVISHRFSTVRRADRIAVLESGRVVESGTHADLLTLGGRYAELFTLQAARFTGSHPSPDPLDQPAPTGPTDPPGALTVPTDPPDAPTASAAPPGAPTAPRAPATSAAPPGALTAPSAPATSAAPPGVPAASAVPPGIPAASAGPAQHSAGPSDRPAGLSDELPEEAVADA
ncbi:ABC transporter ATP-binding protein [Pseudosporangium ferrugineum]|uniref:ATP-binding cassette subfamily B protein n=1 Tax=Pseudosporangium ferrugineum TaxID=439699 RepID=A0A2T0SDL8_9ACTN|nr:ABC transporter ATP-binding protein [Pseudosporangium ferrugineum]PRY31481.1 ATP-binding cassette subfamily B protein [Pseudosporangium ferrugineum]